MIWPKDSLVLAWFGQKTPWCQGWISTKESFGQITPTPRSLLAKSPPKTLIAISLWGTVRNGYRERPTLKMTPPTIVQNFGILEELWRRKQVFSSYWLRILNKYIWGGSKIARVKWYLDASDRKCCYMGCMRPRHKRFSSAVSLDA